MEGLGTIAQSGSLYKRRGGLGKFMGKKWEKRGFILFSNGLLQYYDADSPPVDPSSTPARGVLDMKSNHCVLQVKMPIDGAPTPYTIVISPSNNEKVEAFKLCAETGIDFDAWVKSVEAFAKISQNNSLSESDDEGRSNSPQRVRPAAVDAANATSAIADLKSPPAGKVERRHSMATMFGAVGSKFTAPSPRETEASKSVNAFKKPDSVVSSPAPEPQHGHAAGKTEAPKKKVAGLRAKAVGGSILGSQAVTEAVAVLVVLNFCVYLAFKTDMFKTLDLRENRISISKAVSDTVASVSHTVAVDTHIVPSIASVPNTAPISPNSKPVAGSTFQEVQGVPPNVPDHTWSKCDHSLFQVRIGPDYNKNKKKAPSAAPLYEAFAVDMICTKLRKDHIANRMQLPTDLPETNNPHVPPLLVIQMQIPSDPPTSIFSNVEDGPGWAIVMYYKITDDTRNQLKNLETASPAVKLFANFCEKGEKDPAWRSRFKVICSCTNLDQMGLPSMIVSYNAKPVLIRRTGTFFRGPNHIEFDIHVHKFANLAKQSIHMLSSRCGQMYMQIGFVVEGREDDELPETLFACVGVNKPQEEKGEFVFPEDQE